MADFLGLNAAELENILQQSEFDEIPVFGQPLQPAAPVRKRFEELNQDQIQNFIRNQENENTRKKN